MIFVSSNWFGLAQAAVNSSMLLPGNNEESGPIRTPTAATSEALRDSLSGNVEEIKDFETFIAGFE